MSAFVVMVIVFDDLFPQGLGADSLFEDPDFPADRYYVLLRRYRLSEEREGGRCY